MSVAATSSASSATTPASTGGQSNIGLTSNQFLTLLTTQLQTQNPLDPTDPNQFTTEMVQYASLSQQIDSNAKLDTLSTNLSGLLTQVSLLASQAGATTQA
jgi:flagellar basal-body rod modification protein FlgD